MEGEAFVPGHITGFFEIYLEEDDPLKCGSRGAGFCISKGASTHIELTRAEKQSVIIKFNGEFAPPASTSRRVVDLILGSEPYEVIIDTSTELPISQGLGLSGAGALGTAIALDDALDLNNSPDKLVGYAHMAEVESRTGLGDVIAQSRGGLEMRNRPGAPPHGLLKVRRWEEEVLIVVFEPPLSTKHILTSPAYQVIINKLASRMLEEFEAGLTPELFVKLAREFTEQSDLTSEVLLKALKQVPEGFGAGMAMLGNSLFITGEGAHGLAVNFNKLGKCIKTEVYNKGAFNQTATIQ
jgi:pantoate kinase